MCQSELAEFLAELTELGAELSEFSLPKQYSRNSIPPSLLHLQLLRKLAFCRLLPLCVLPPVLLRPVLWHCKIVLELVLCCLLWQDTGNNLPSFYRSITRMNVLFSKLFRGLQLQLSGAFRIDLHYSHNFLVLRMQLQIRIPLWNFQDFCSYSYMT